LFTATGGGGTAIFAAGQTVTVTTASENTNANMQTNTPANSNTQSFNASPLYFRIGTPQGSAATANVALVLQPL
jgi:hypothetical protein